MFGVRILMMIKDFQSHSSYYHYQIGHNIHLFKMSEQSSALIWYEGQPTEVVQGILHNVITESS